MQLHFLLIQNGKILGGGRKPLQLPYSKLDPEQSWRIVAGVECAAGRWVIGNVVTYTARPDTLFYRVTSPRDGYMRKFDRIENSVQILFEKIRIYESQGGYNDHANLTHIELWDSER
jgi:hypothetical protein